MIIVISQHTSEHTTDHVIDWLNYYGEKFYRFNGIESLYELTYYSGQKHSGLSSESELHKLLQDSSNIIWYRRWMAKEYYYIIGEISDSISLNRTVADYVQQESNVLRKYLLEKVYYKKMLSDFNQLAINKLNVLEVANRAGLLIPEGIVSSSKKKLIEFFVRYPKVIVKNLSDPTFIQYNKQFYATYTSILNEELIAKLPDVFFPSLVQEYIEKLFEIRVFYLDKKFFSMAIFSQENEKTKVDFRKYDFYRPNRNVPYRLPLYVEAQLQQIMEELHLNCGSIDLIKTPDNKYYFLEINPIGQFGMVSEPCNYFLEEKVAQWLIQN